LFASVSVVAETVTATQRSQLRSPLPSILQAFVQS